MAEQDERESRRCEQTEKVSVSDRILRTLSRKVVKEWEELATYLDFDNADIRIFKRDNPQDTVQQIYTMLTQWRQNQPASVNQTDALCTALEEVRRADLAIMLRELVQKSQEFSRPSIGIMENQPSTSQGPTTQPVAAQTPAQIAAGNCEEAIKKHYRSSGHYVQLIPWVDDDKMHIMDIYTRLQLATEDKVTCSLDSHEGIMDMMGSQRLNLRIKDKGTRSFNSYKDKGTRLLDSYEKIFSLKTREGDLIKRAILNGLAGRGKSTLFDKMAYDWAVKACRALKKFKLVILLKMCALDQSSQLIDAIFDQLLDEDTRIDRGDLGVFIDNNPEKILILLDGFDELMTTSLCNSSFGSILKILNRKKCRECFVLVTTRPSHFDKLATNQLVQKPFIHVTVLGFNHHDVQDYVNKFYRNEHDKANRLLERIKSSQILHNFAVSPMLLLMMCLLGREGSALPETSSRLYKKAVEYIFKRKVEDVTPEKIWQIVTEIGKIGFNGLLQPSQVLSFKEKDFEKHVLKMGIKVGLLTRQRVLKGLDTHNSIQFIHKTFQEFCAAKYLQSLVEVDMKGFQESLDQMMRFPMVFEYLLRFCSGDSEVCTNKVIQALQENCPQEEMGFGKPLGQLALHCFFEGQSEQLPLETFIHSVITDRLHLEGEDRDCFNSSTYFLKHVADQTKITGNTYLAKVVELLVGECSLEQFGASLTHVISSMTNLQTLLLQCPRDCNEKHIASPFSGETSKFVPELAHIDARGSAAFWFPDLKQMKGLRVLELSHGSPTVEDMKHITKSLSDLPNLTELTFSFCQMAGSVALWVVHLQSLKCLQKLDLNHCSLTGEDMVHTVKSLCHLPVLMTLSVVYNGLGGSVTRWVIPLQSLKRLQKLDLRHCSLTGEDMMHLVESLCHLPDLIALSFAWNKLGGSAALWAIHLQRLKRLQELDLSCCCLTGEDMLHIVEPLCDLPDLAELRFHDNKKLRGSATLWSSHLKEFKHLRTLHISWCSLTDEDKKLISESLSHLGMGCMLNCIN